MLGSHGDTGPGLRLRRHGSRGTASVEYSLLVALIGAVLCLGVGVAVKTVFQDTVACLLQQWQAESSPACAGGGVPPGGPGSGPGSGPGPGTSPTSTPTPTPTQTPCPTDPPSPDDQPCATPSPTDSP